MKFDGKTYANTILATLKPTVSTLREQGIVPTLAAILVGDNASSLSFIRQKRIAAEAIGAMVVLHQLPVDATDADVAALIHTLNTNPAIHGVIMQRPLPTDSPVRRETLLGVRPTKDIDGFVPGSPYAVPVAQAITKILEAITRESGIMNSESWEQKTIVVVGRGETAGKPIAAHLTSLPRMDRPKLTVVHSQTEHTTDVLKSADIIISCTGKRGIITKETIKPGVILIGVGIGRDDDAKLQGDYDEHEIAEIASWYTPTPGGVGPVNVACLMENLVAAATLTAK